MKAIVLGSGNLGTDLVQQAPSSAAVSTMLKLRYLCETAERARALANDLNHTPDLTHVFYCIGGGSVKEAKEDFARSAWLNAGLPMFLVERLRPSIHLVLFSSDYAACEVRPGDPIAQGTPRSAYALCKQSLETAVRLNGRKNTLIIRVGTLYGEHHPDRTLMYRLIRALSYGSKALSTNLITPTPTRWLAKQVWDAVSVMAWGMPPQYAHCAPSGNVPVYEFARILSRQWLPNVETPKAGAPDLERPLVSRLENTLTHDATDWLSLWSDESKIVMPRVMPLLLSMPG